ncbi:hypothetical protein VBQ76_24825 [Klebsiella pneumoniae]|nr:hypothetical protein [Klebsiella pneumoniae]
MSLNDLFQELKNEEYDKVWLYRTYGAQDDDGNFMLLDLLLSSSGEEIARCGYWPEQNGRNWQRLSWGMKGFTVLPASADELLVKTVLTNLAIGICPITDGIDQLRNQHG